MERMAKIVVIGGGSSYTPELMDGFIRRFGELPLSELWLVDIEEGKPHLDVIAALAQRMWDATPHKVTVHATLDRRQALPGADFVITQFRVGFLRARVKDERIPLMHGMLGQETNGAGGMFKALRTIPVMQEMVQDMKELCPQAWLINFTNPSGMITEAVIKHMGWRRCIGLCNVPTISMMREPALLGKTREELNYRFYGLNHFHWHTVTDSHGRDVTPQIMEHINQPDGGTPVNIVMEPFPRELLDALRMLPCGYHRYYYLHEEMLAHSLDSFAKHATRAEQMMRIEEELFKIYENPALYEKPAELDDRGGAYYSDAACECVSAIWNDKKLMMVVSTQNNGALPCLAPESIVEASCLISARGAEPLAVGKIGSAQKGWLQMMKAMEECVIEAAFTGDYGLVLQAFMLNPMVKNGREAVAVLNELFVAHRKYLPRFANKIDELEQAGVGSRDEVIEALMKLDA